MDKRMDRYVKLLEAIRTKPGLYIGRPSLERLGAFLGGYIHSIWEEDADPTDFNSYFAPHPGFLKFVQEKYNINTSHNAMDIIQFFSFNNDEVAFNTFFELLEEFNNNQNS